LDGRVAVVSGGGRGLGRSFCLALARQGAKVVVSNRNRVTDADGRGPADHVASEIAAAGGEAVADYSDAADPAAGEATVTAALERWRRLDICVANAYQRLYPLAAAMTAQFAGCTPFRCQFQTGARPGSAARTVTSSWSWLAGSGGSRPSGRRKVRSPSSRSTENALSRSVAVLMPTRLRFTLACAPDSGARPATAGWS